MKKMGLWISAGIALSAGAISWLIVRDSVDMYQVVTKPPLSPPAWLFPLVWTALYMLMGVSAYWMYEKKDRPALAVYGLQLLVNAIWPVLFFKYHALLAAFLWLLLLFALVLLMIFLFYRISKAAARLQLPYLIWLIYAGYLNFFIYWLYP